MSPLDGEGAPVPTGATRPAGAVRRTALVLCGGGITGAMYEIGALAALDDYFAGSFDVGRFDLYVGTSAGAMVATAMAVGLAPRRLFRAILDPHDDFLRVSRGDIYRLDSREILRKARDLAAIVAGSLYRMARRRELNLHSLTADLEDALPSGIFTLDHLERYLGDFFARNGLPTRFGDVPRQLFITANDLDSGHRVIFGRAPHKDPPIPRAICASSAIPIFFEPVRIDGRDYIDGAVGKVDHADVAIAQGAELVIVINPMVPIRNDPEREGLPTPIPGAHRLGRKGLLTVADQARRMSLRTKLHQALRRYRAQYPGVSLLLIEPHDEEADMFLSNPMDFTARRRLMRYGYESAARQLRGPGRAAFDLALARHDIAGDAARLVHPPSELAP